MLEIYERVKGPFRSRKHEFVYEDGYPLREGRMVWLVYTKEDKVDEETIREAVRKAIKKAIL